MNFTLSQPGAIGTTAMDGVKGVNNHVIQVEASGSTETAFNIWMFDSGDYSKVENVPGYDWVALSQIEWYHEMALSIQRDAGVCVCCSRCSFCRAHCFPFTFCCGVLCTVIIMTWCSSHVHNLLRFVRCNDVIMN